MLAATGLLVKFLPRRLTTVVTFGSLQAYGLAVLAFPSRIECLDASRVYGVEVEPIDRADSVSSAVHLLKSTA